jgi:MYXO-CTERM domain-containing protein
MSAGMSGTGGMQLAPPMNGAASDCSCRIASTPRSALPALVLATLALARLVRRRQRA